MQGSCQVGSLRVGLHGQQGCQGVGMVVPLVGFQHSTAPAVRRPHVKVYPVETEARSNRKAIANAAAHLGRMVPLIVVDFVVDYRVRWI